MALPLVLPNASNFLGVALVVNRNREGPRFVFHYPSRILPPHEGQRKEFTVDEPDDDDFPAADDVEKGSALGGSRDFMPNAGELSRWNYDDHLVADNGTQFVPWEYVAGLPTKALESILTPPHAFHKKRFQISLDSVSYLSYPVHVPASGYWDRTRNRRGKLKEKLSSSRGHGLDEATARDGNAADEKEDKASSMTMFSLVFILSPKRHEADELLDTMFNHVVREVNKVYKYCQESGDFVWQECKKIIQLKDKARENRVRMSVLWKEILAISSLATSMRDVHEAICRNRIAVLELSLGKGSVAHSVQIPMPFYVSDIQPLRIEAAQGLWLTTANALSGYDALSGLAAFDKCFALLLTDDDDKKIIAELQARGDKATAAMIELVKVSKPTMSFHQISQLPDTMLTIQQVRAYAQHFIYWRRAMAVPPIHARDVYVLSPNCDVSSLAQAASSFAQAFPFAPPLPDLLAELSSAPRPFKSFCLVKQQRPAYLRILAWLIRGGWVCQLCTFAYVVVWPEIQYEVEYNLEADYLVRVKQKQQRDSVKEAQRRAAPSFADQQDEEKERKSQQHGDRGGLSEGSDDTEPGGLSAMSDTVSSHPSSSRHDRLKYDAGIASGRPATTAAEHAAERARRQRIAEKEAHDLAERATAHARKPAPKCTDHPSTNGAAHLVGMLPHVILDASKPTGRESLYLSAIERNLRACRSTPLLLPSKKDAATSAAGPVHGAHGQGHIDEISVWNERVGEMWPVFWKHFNGRSALERIALLEDMKRKDVWNLLSSMSEYLLCVRHW